MAPSVSNFFNVILDLLIALIPIVGAVAVVVFLWGIVKFIAHADDPKTIEEGRRFMIWGMIALFFTVGLWGVVAYVQESLIMSNDAPDSWWTIPTTVSAT
jgi:hypothetical protein